MSDLPTGTITLLFTDIEGSTRLLEEVGERYSELLGAHRRVLHESFARHGGVEFGTEGDAVFAAFTRASDAVAAAADAQRGLTAGLVRVRIGIHTGEPKATDEVSARSSPAAPDRARPLGGADSPSQGRRQPREQRRAGGSLPTTKSYESSIISRMVSSGIEPSMITVFQ